MSNRKQPTNQFSRLSDATGFTGDVETLSDIEHLVYSAARFSFKAYMSLTPQQRAAADYGIRRHLAYCKRVTSLKYDPDAIREIIEDSARDQASWIESERHNQQTRAFIREARSSGILRRQTSQI